MTTNYTAVATKKHPIPRAKISDGLTVTVMANETKSKTLEPQTFVTIGGFTGLITEKTVIEANTPTKVVLTIEQAEYETTQIDTSVDYKTGDFLYLVGDKFTNAAPEENAIKVGKLVNPKNSLNAITFILLPQVY